MGFMLVYFVYIDDKIGFFSWSVWVVDDFFVVVVELFFDFCWVGEMFGVVGYGQWVDGFVGNCMLIGIYWVVGMVIGVGWYFVVMCEMLVEKIFVVLGGWCEVCLLGIGFCCVGLVNLLWCFSLIGNVDQ